MKYFTICVIFFEVLALFFATSDSVSHVTFANGIFNVTWKYLSASQEIEFEVSAKTNGYVALGLTKINSDMQNLDLFVGGVTLAGTSYLKDYYVTGQGQPPEDSQQDYTLLSASESNGVTMVRCKRRLNTQDVKDLQIQAGDKVYLAWAYHTNSDSLIYHSGRGYSPLHELVPVPQTTTSSPTSAPTTAPSIVYSKELAFKNGDFRVFWKFDSNRNELFFKLVVKATGWVGLGFSQQNSAMTNLDIVVAGVSAGQGYIRDYYSSSQGAPPIDTTQNYILISAVEDAVTTTVEFKRPIDTGDVKDLQIAPGTSYYLAWGYHSSDDTLSYHGNVDRGYSTQKIVLVEAVPTPSPSSTATMTTSSMTTSAMTTSVTTTTSTMMTPVMATPIMTTSTMATSAMTTSTMATPAMTTSTMATADMTTSTMATAVMTTSTMATAAMTTSTMATADMTTSTMATAAMTTSLTMATTSSRATTTSTMETTSSITTTSVITRPSSTTRVVTTTVTITTTPQTEQVFKNGDFRVSWKFDSNTNELLFKLVVKATGWVGLGISNINTDMKDMDVVVAGVSGGQGYIGDYYATAQTAPPRDSTQNYQLISANESGDTTTVEFKRKLDTGDAKDQQIERGQSYYIAWAYHSSSDTLSYHGSQLRGYSGQKVVLVTADAGSTTARPPSTSTTQKPVPITAATTTKYSLWLITLLFFASLLLK